jgi:hypothetical protein
MTRTTISQLHRDVDIPNDRPNLLYESVSFRCPGQTTLGRKPVPCVSGCPEALAQVMYSWVARLPGTPSEFKKHILSFPRGDVHTGAAVRCRIPRDHRIRWRRTPRWCYESRDVQIREVQKFRARGRTLTCDIRRESLLQHRKVPLNSKPVSWRA